jgi:hypothetical protein
MKQIKTNSKLQELRRNFVVFETREGNHRVFYGAASPLPFHCLATMINPGALKSRVAQQLDTTACKTSFKPPLFWNTKIALGQDCDFIPY